MQLRLVREDFMPECCIGRLFVDGRFECYSLEDPVREIEGVPVFDWKVYGKTAIPYGAYRVTITMSNRFKRPLPLLLDVPGFAGIRIHTGNTAASTEGCILVGALRSGQSLLQSRIAFDALFPKLQGAIAFGDQIHIDVVRA